MKLTQSWLPSIPLCSSGCCTMATLTIERYQDSMAKEWDKFVFGSSANGTFLQSRRFLSYHPAERFVDFSLVIRKGQEIVAVVPACSREGENGAEFVSHAGSTFGGIVVSPKYLAISKAISLVGLVDEWLKEAGFCVSTLKQTADFFCRKESSAIEYALQHEGYSAMGEISFVIELEQYPEPVEMNFTASRRRDCRYGEKAGCKFVRLDADEEIADFYTVLEKSLEKFDAKPVHSLEELLDFKNTRLANEVEFYGVRFNDALIAGSLVFLFGDSVFHTQYLAADADYLDVFPMNYMDWNLIRIAKQRGFARFSFGVSTEDHGRVLNSTLATFKEGFGGCHSINRTFTKEFRGVEDAG